MKEKFKGWPKGMEDLDLPNKSSRQVIGAFVRPTPMPKTNNAFLQKVQELRILLNKMTRLNFKSISEKILNDFNFTPSLLKELAVIKLPNLRKYFS
jgi:hypothetical protein